MRSARPILRSMEYADMATKPKKVQITTALPDVPLLLPKVVILRRDDGGAMVSWPAKEMAAKARSSSEGCLTAFLELAQAGDEQVVEYARGWGALLLENVERRYKDEEQFISDAAPVAASNMDIQFNMIKQSPGFREFVAHRQEEGLNRASEEEYQWKSWPVSWDCEPTDVYRRYATQARALLQIAAKLSTDEVAELELWQQAIRPDAPEEFHWPTSEDFRKQCRPQRDLEVQRHLLGKLVTGWIEKSSLHPQFMWTEPDHPQVVFNVNLRYDGDDFARISKLWHSERALFRAGEPEHLPPKMPLFNVLTLQLLAMLTSRNGLHVCDGEGCTNIFNPEGGIARRDRGTFCCDECRENAKRKRSREFNRKKRASQSE